MNKKILIPVICLFIIIIVGFLAWRFWPNNIGFITPEEMRVCDVNEDCIPVGCNCTCSGCGGFSYEDIINKEYKNDWYAQNNCSEPEICPMVCCEPAEIRCLNNQCSIASLIN
ncbi:MAG: hypothetical protein PHV47_02750 [Candidatus Pacebacteria bacterium]|nr:hypothetical protein [Candidatus Paceibacterota bacterium]MDD5621109.1 hypothetical protein [Candidatus Paceibacterota bacterium]